MSSSSSDADNNKNPATTTILPVQIVFYQQGQPKRPVQIDCQAEDTIQTLKTKLAEKIGGESRNEAEQAGRMNVLFCGKALADDDRIAKFELGPMTSLTAVLMKKERKRGGNAHDEEQREEDGDGDISSSEEDEWVKIVQQQQVGDDNGGSAKTAAEESQMEAGEARLVDTVVVEQSVDEPAAAAFGTFHLFCKRCECLERAKLRAYCRQCQHGAIEFSREQEPRSWRDVMDTNQLQVDCRECNGQQGVIFRFKCTKCNEIGAPLTHLKRFTTHPPTPAGQSSCAICAVSCNNSPQHQLHIKLDGCAHLACVECFCAYAKQAMEQKCLFYNPVFGYTICCPVYGCQASVSDVHLFYLLGTEAYKKYQEMAARMYFERHAAARCYCPAADCGAGFFIDDEEGDDENFDEALPMDRMFRCPECHSLFCRFCRKITDQSCRYECQCLAQEVADENAELIGRITKPCPNCRAPTERSGGCAHMHCPQCKADWCFVCQRNWTVDCQWDHWFE